MVDAMQVPVEEFALVSEIAQCSGDASYGAEIVQVKDDLRQGEPTGLQITCSQNSIENISGTALVSHVQIYTVLNDLVDAFARLEVQRWIKSRNNFSCQPTVYIRERITSALYVILPLGKLLAYIVGH